VPNPTHEVQYETFSLSQQLPLRLIRTQAVFFQ
jgi:hypothetical protein